MRSAVIPTIILLLICFRSAAAADCESYTGIRMDTAKEVATPLGKALTAIKTRNAKELFAIASSKLILLRRVVTAGEDSRTGNVRLSLRPRDIDSNLNIRIGAQTFSNFAEQTVFNALNVGSVIAIAREICEGARHCDDALPSSEEVPFLIKDLLQCNRGANGVYLFSDGMFVTDMQISTERVPVGSALFFTKEAGSYRLAGLIIQR